MNKTIELPEIFFNQVLSLLDNMENGKYFVDKEDYFELIENPLQEKLINKLISVIDTLKETADKADIIARGNYEADVNPKNDKDVLGIALQAMTLTLRQASQIAESISEGNLETKIEVKGNDDLLALSMNKMVDTLRESIKKQNTNLLEKSLQTELSKILITSNTLTSLSTNTLKFVCENLKASSAVLYTSDENTLNLGGTYAVSNNKLREKISFGDGIIGQVALNKKAMITEDIPNENLIIESSIFQAKPLHSYVVPLIFQDELYGVIEIATFTKLNSNSKTLLNNFTEFIALNINNIQKIEELSQVKKVQELVKKLAETNQSLESKSVEIEYSNAELEENQVKLEEQKNELEEQTNELKAQYKDIEIKNLYLESSKKSLEIANKHKTEFLANVSHELRTPLNSIIMLSKLLSDDMDKYLLKEDVKKLNIINSS